jgi:hypothetical protein
MSQLEQELFSALQTLEAEPEKPCGCHGSKATPATDPFASLSLESVNAAAALDSALNALLAEATPETDLFETLSVEDELEFLEFGALDEDLSVDLNDIISAAEKFPGLKITFSF